MRCSVSVCILALYDIILYYIALYETYIYIYVYTLGFKQQLFGWSLPKNPCFTKDFYTTPPAQPFFVSLKANSGISVMKPGLFRLGATGGALGANTFFSATVAA